MPLAPPVLPVLPVFSPNVSHKKGAKINSKSFLSCFQDLCLPLQSLRWILLLETKVTKIKDLPSELCGKFLFGLWNYLASELEASRSIWCCDIVGLIIAFECFGKCHVRIARRPILKQPMVHLRWGCGHRLVEPQLCRKTVPTRFIQKVHVTSRSICFNHAPTIFIQLSWCI